MSISVMSVSASNFTGGVSFVFSAKQAYGSWSNDGGMTWNFTTNASTTSFSKLCSSQSYAPNTFGTGQGFVDYVYITGEEIDNGRLFALDIENRQLYQLSGVTGSAPSPNGGMPIDAWENPAGAVSRSELRSSMVMASP